MGRYRPVGVVVVLGGGPRLPRILGIDRQHPIDGHVRSGPFRCAGLGRRRGLDTQIRQERQARHGGALTSYTTTDNAAAKTGAPAATVAAVTTQIVQNAPSPSPSPSAVPGPAAAVAGVAVSVPAVAAEPVAAISVAPQSIRLAQPAVPRVARVVSRLLAAVGLAPLAVNSPVAPAQPPALLALLAWARREVERDLAPLGKTAAQSTVLTAAAADASTAAVVTTPPSSLPSTPIGWVTGQRNSGIPGYNWPQTNNTAGFGIYGTDLGIMWDDGA